MVRQFTGTHDHKLDDKGRVALPNDFRKVLTSRASSGELVIVPKLHDPRAHVVFTAEGYGTLIERHNNDSYGGDRQTQRLMSIKLIKRAAHVQVDDNGRVLLPKALREDIGLVKDVRFVGDGAVFEIWEPTACDAFEAEIEAAADSDVFIDYRGVE